MNPLSRERCLFCDSALDSIYFDYIDYPIGKDLICRNHCTNIYLDYYHNMIKCRLDILLSGKIYSVENYFIDNKTFIYSNFDVKPIFTSDLIDWDLSSKEKFIEQLSILLTFN